MSEKKYHDLQGNKLSLYQMVRCEPVWAQTRIEEGEKAIAKLVERDAEIKEMRELLENFRTSSLIPSDVAVHKIRDYLKTGGCGE